MERSIGCEISVIILTYNPDLDKLIKTLETILIQKDVDLEIIVADDGSKINRFIEVELYFEKKNFKHYHLISNKENKGTVYNLYSALQEAKGNYVKTISPGDMLCKERVLRNWIDFMVLKKYEWSFSEAIYYYLNEKKSVVVSVKARPRNVKPYLHNNRDICRWNYVVLEDIALGAAVLGKRELQLEYCERLLDNVIYAEDNMWRLLMFDGIVGGYFPEYSVMYEYGEGISTSKDGVWEVRLKRDWDNTTCMMFKDYDKLDVTQKKMVRANIKWNKGLFNRLFVKGSITSMINNRLRPRLTIDYITE